MSLTLSDLPLLLAGPMLRRVEADLVCVWIATSQPCNASLLLFDGGDVAASDTPLGDQRAEWASDVQATLPIGPHLHVLAITLDLRTPGGNAVRTNGALLPNRTYSYDLNFFTRDDPATRHTLLTEGLLNDPVPLGYDRGELPSFVTPPDQREQLVVLHGSCRELFAVPPVEDEAALDDDPFEPPGGWPTAEVTPDNPAPVPDPENDPFPSDAYPAFPKRDGISNSRVPLNPAYWMLIALPPSSCATIGPLFRRGTMYTEAGTPPGTGTIVFGPSARPFRALTLNDNGSTADRPYKRPMLAAEPVEASCNRGADGRSPATIPAEPLAAAIVWPVNLCV